MYRVHRKYILIPIFLIVFTHSRGQVYQNINYNVDDGLPSSEAFQVIQDKKGYIWIATTQGVSRFDGYTFTNYDHQDGLARNTILELYEDYKGRIWMVSLSGELSWFENDSIYNYIHNEKILAINQNSAGHPIKQSFFVDSSENIYLGFYYQGLIKISENGEIQILLPDDPEIINRIDIIDKRKAVTSGIRHKIPVKGVELYTQNKKTIIHEQIETHHRINCIYDNGTIYYALNNKLLVIDRTGNVSTYTYEEEIIWLSVDQGNYVWLGFKWGGINAFSKDNFEIPKIKLLQNEFTTSIFQDNEGGYWVSTYHDGIYYYPSLEVKSYSKGFGIDTDVIKEVESHENKIWFAGNSNTLYWLENGELNSIKNFRDDIIHFTSLNSVGDSLFINTQGERYRNNLYYNGSISYIGEYALKDVILLNNNILLAMYIWIRITSLVDEDYSYVPPNGYSNIYAAINYNKDTAWIGTDNGIFALSLIEFTTEKVDLSPILNVRINCLYKDLENNIWVGTKGGGLIKVNNGNVHVLTTSDGLPGNSINGIEEYNNIIWAATNRGVAKITRMKPDKSIIHERMQIDGWNYFDGEYCKIECITSINGLISNEIYDMSVDSLNVFCGTNRGLSIFTQDISGENNVPPPIYLNTVLINGKEEEHQDHYQLNHNQNNIEIHYTGISYKRESDLYYEYILEGIRSDWKTTTNRTIQYPTLPPGNYTFKIKALNASGIESSKPLVISFNIKKAYYQTILFQVILYLIITLIISTIFLLFFRLKMKELAKRNRVKGELNHFRQRALSAQMNPHFIYNSLNSIQSYIFKNDKIRSSEYISKLGGVMRRTLENSQHSLITLKEEIEALRMYVDLELIRFRHQFSFQLNIDSNVNLEKIYVPPLMIQPYIENAIHHGLRPKKGDKELKISVHQEDSGLLVEIEDNGIGRKEAAKKRKKFSKSLGTQITEKRLLLYKELYQNDVKIEIIDLADQNTRQTGTRIKIKLKQDYFINLNKHHHEDNHY